MNPRRVLAPARWVTYLLVALGLCYLGWRFESYTLPDGGCSPLLRFAPGQALLVDRYPPGFDRGDALLFRAPDGLIYLGLVERRRSGAAGASAALWIAVDNPACAGSGSERLGWIEEREVVARVVLAWPW